MEEGGIDILNNALDISPVDFLEIPERQITMPAIEVNASCFKPRVETQNELFEDWISKSKGLVSDETRVRVI